MVMFEPKKIIKDAENNLYVCLDMSLGFCKKEEKKWYSIFNVNSYYSKVVCIMLNNTKDTLYFFFKNTIFKI